MCSRFEKEKMEIPQARASLPKYTRAEVAFSRFPLFSALAVGNFCDGIKLFVTNTDACYNRLFVYVYQKTRDSFDFISLIRQ